MARSRRNLDDLLGNEAEEVERETVETDWAKLRKGVSLTWLGGFTRMDRKTVKKRLSDCPAIGKMSGSELYDPLLALSYLIKPRFDIRDYIKTMNPTELPPMLRKEFWDAENKRLKYQQAAGELWPTESVLSVLAEAFKRIKQTTQVWADDVEREAGMPREQYLALIARVDALREDLYRALVEMPKHQNTLSALDHGPDPSIEVDEDEGA